MCAMSGSSSRGSGFTFFDANTSLDIASYFVISGDTLLPSSTFHDAKIDQRVQMVTT